ncbi:unnamed protein product [Leptidea sinapis]|uniref:Uncharacterized protein n=1 Tax=Leptidea sinapis TaxID=189913 RepID=A0A5E4QQE4_9NEOP|nr:unnamed protein product [Leptidea sinapis]
MRDLNYTYRKALSIYLRENGVKKIDNDQPKENLNTVTENQSLGRSYKDVIMISTQKSKNLQMEGVNRKKM